ncbi:MULTISPECIES: HPF/RaiA family ribosome-associated protein [Ralstonia]|uniref:HPF/RaiA family ribosome-associated protein n=1 Tax=Ralstonia TaxID=48736 RepID=UPI0002EA5085|nr:MULTISPECIES: HPF/RaiA family ribosome-associated protein [Ralstonia]MDH6645005.1 ribosome-associated translation inhibitor RaiA [Ralstonia sp. GP73]
MKFSAALEDVAAPDIGSRSVSVTLPLDISFRDFPYSKAIEDAVIEQANSLARFQAEIARCRVKLIQLPRQQTPIQSVRVHIDVMTRHDSHLSGHASGEDARAALREAFREVEFALRREMVRGQSKATIAAKGGI